MIFLTEIPERGQFGMGNRHPIHAPQASYISIECLERDSVPHSQDWQDQWIRIVIGHAALSAVDGDVDPAYSEILNIFHPAVFVK